jgi:MoaA/NifB/PqqE/SkfB family radical SAM enzyme
MRRSENIGRYKLDKEYVKNLIDSAAEKGIKSLSFTGGEPLLFLDDIIELTNHATAAGIPYVRTGTNGFFFKDSEDPGYLKRIHSIAEKIAATKIYTFWISLDSANPVDHENMRGISGVVKGIEKALPVFHEYGIYPSVNLGINRATGGSLQQPFLSQSSREEFLESFKQAFTKFYSFAHNIGFTMVNACYPMSNSTDSEELKSNVYGAASSSSVISFSRDEKALLFQALFETIPKFRGKLQIFSPRCSLHGLIRKFADRQSPLFPCRGGTDFFFVECEKGRIHPCGYRHEHQNQLPDLVQRFGKIVDCDICEWECFRDPSDVLGPFADMFTQPLKLCGKIIKEPHFFRLLIEDLRYYSACNYFNGRLAPQYAMMKRFERT